MSEQRIAFEQMDHIITKQYKEEQEMLATFAAGNYTLSNPYVKVNPYGIAPLTALVMFKTTEEVEATVTVKGKEEAGNISHTFAKNTEHQLPVLGLYPNDTNQVVITLSNGETHTLEVITDALEGGVKEATYIKTTGEYFEDHLMFITPAGKSLPAAYDYQGKCRWYFNLPFIFDMKRAQNGNILIGSYRLVGQPYYTTGVFEVSLIGKAYKEYRLPGAYHHDQFEMEDGNLLILTEDFSRGTVEDMCVLVDRKTGEILKTFDYKKVLPQDVGGSGSQDAHDWFHNNAVWYDKKTNSITLSGRHQDAVINLDFETGDLNWIIGDPEGWPQEMVDKYFFTPVGDGEFDWQYEQHACVITPEGDVMMFDNGHYRSKNKENYILNKDNFSRGVRYKINTEDMTIEQVWQFGKERGEDFFSPYICNVEYYADGHYLVHSGGIAYKDGHAAEALGAFLMEDPEAETKAITVEVLNDEVVFEMHVPGNHYRGEKLKLYTDKENLVFGKGEVLGRLGVTEEFETEIPSVEETGMLLPETNEGHLTLEEDRMVFKGKFEKGQVVMIMLEGETTHRYFVPTTARNFLAMCSGTFLETDERRVTFNIHKENLKGTFKVTIIIEDKKYETGITVTF